MKTIKQFSIKLERGQVFRLREPARAIVLKCTQGRAWVTSTNDLEDHILVVGGEIELPANASIVVEGLADQLEFNVALCA